MGDFEALAMESDLRSMAYVTYFIEGHKRNFLTQERQVEQLQTLAKSRKLTWTVDYYQKGKSVPYDTKHDGSSLYQKVRSVVSSNEVKRPQFHGLGDDESVIRFFEIGKDLFADEYYGKLEDILRKDVGIVISEDATTDQRPKRSAARNTATGSSNDQSTAKVPNASKAKDSEGQSKAAKSKAKPQLQIDKSTSDSKVEQDQSEGNPQTKGTTLPANNQTQGPKDNSDPKKPTSTVPKRKKDEKSPTEDLLDIDIGGIMERLHGSIQGTVATVLKGEGGRRPAHIDLRPTQDLEKLYIAVFGREWKATVTTLAAELNLTSWDCLHCLVWAFIVEHIAKRDLLPGSICSLLKNDGAPRKYLTPILAESKLDFDVFVKQAMLNQFRDEQFRQDHIAHVVSRLANELCMILNGHLSLLNRDHFRPNWFRNLMRLLPDIFEMVLKLQAKLEADEDDWYLQIFPHGNDFDKSEMQCQDHDSSGAISLTVIPGIYQQPQRGGPKVLVKAMVKRMVATSIDRTSEMPSSSRQAGGTAEGGETAATK